MYMKYSCASASVTKLCYTDRPGKANHMQFCVHSRHECHALSGSCSGTTAPAVASSIWLASHSARSSSISTVSCKLPSLEYCSNCRCACALSSTPKAAPSCSTGMHRSRRACTTECVVGSAQALSDVHRRVPALSIRLKTSMLRHALNDSDGSAQEHAW
jgi:hypothetical protein